MDRTESIFVRYCTAHFQILKTNNNNWIKRENTRFDIKVNKKVDTKKMHRSDPTPRGRQSVRRRASVADVQADTLLGPLGVMSPLSPTTRFDRSTVQTVRNDCIRLFWSFYFSATTKTILSRTQQCIRAFRCSALRDSSDQTRRQFVREMFGRHSCSGRVFTRVKIIEIMNIKRCKYFLCFSVHDFRTNVRSS